MIDRMQDMIATAAAKGREAVSWIITEDAWQQLLQINGDPGERRMFGLPVAIAQRSTGDEIKLLTLNDLTA